MTLHDLNSLRAETLGPATISRSQRFRLRSRHVDQDFIVDVALPPGPLAEGQTLPVVYVTDGGGLFGLTTQTSRAMQMGPFPLPATLVVGIGYPGETPGEAVMGAHLRVRDLSPWVDEAHERRFRNAPPPWTLPTEIRQGGADAFLAFIEEDLKPFIAEHYPVDPSDQTLVGMSLGGLLTMHALFTAPRSFHRYVALSPSLYWNRRRIFEEEAALAARAKDLPVKLFLAVGGLEEGYDPECAMVSNLYQMEARLRSRGYPGLQLDFDVFPGETHMSVYAAAVTRGLATVFGGPGDVCDWSKALRT